MQTAELNYHAERAGTVAHWLVWVSAKNRSTGAVTSRGFWTGDDDATFSIGGVDRDYAGGGQLSSVPSIPQETGLAVRMIRLEMTDLPEVVELVRTLNPKAVPVEIHRAVFDLDTRELVAEPEEVFVGKVDETPIETGAIGGRGRIGVVVASLTRALTRTVPLYKSAAALLARATGDEFRKYVATTQRWNVPWGERAQGSD